MPRPRPIAPIFRAALVALATAGGASTFQPPRHPASPAGVRVRVVRALDRPAPRPRLRRPTAAGFVRSAPPLVGGPRWDRPGSGAARSTPTALPSADPSSSLPPDLSDLGGTAAAALAALALIIGIAAQSLINSTLKGDRGLGAYLSDGTGYSRSGFKPRSGGGGDGEERGDAPLGGPDPLPWLRLPSFEYVEVAGRPDRDDSGAGATEDRPEEMDPEEEARIVSRLEEIADLMRAELAAGNVEEATRLRDRLESLMAEHGMEYEEGFQ